MSAATATVMTPPLTEKKLEKKPIKFSNLLLGAGLNLFEVTTLGQPLEVVKTTMAANRGDSFGTALGRIWGRGGPLGCKHYFPFLRGLFIRNSTASSLSSPSSRQCRTTRHQNPNGMQLLELPLISICLHSLPGSNPLGLDRSFDQRGRAAFRRL